MTGSRLRISIAVAVAVIAAVSALAAYANVQLLSSASQHDRVGQLTPVLPHANPAPRPKPVKPSTSAPATTTSLQVQESPYASGAHQGHHASTDPRHASAAQDPSAGEAHRSSTGGDQRGSSAPDRPAEDPQSGHDDSPKPDDD